MVFEKITLVELRVEDAHIGGETPADGDDEMDHGSMTMESDESARRTIAGRVRRVAVLGAVVGAVVAVGAVARRVRGRGREDVDEEHEIELEDDVELTA
ncbi:hypothetical protein [Haloarchaeobius salinus]|uniref:hypothetical protein n=1 Tax=Haloarchaeobius salinus TaxID=1198298 RepID=UPI00210D1E50|nr:hypothetical protein [Haloarchaeobius salinus]